MAGNWLLTKIFDSRANEFAGDADCHEYLRELSSLNAEKLAREPERLAEERIALQDETENLAYSNYKTFIEAAKCSKEIYDDFTIIDQSVDSVLEILPGLNDKGEQFLLEARKINSRRASAALALQKHPHVLEILEIPQVMDTCVRAGYYEEALELSQYVGKLERRLNHLPIIKNIAADVAAQRELLLEKLLEQLRASLTLSQCLKVVGYCRRLNVFSEGELRTKFLLARSSWYDNLLASVPADDAYQHITKVMELSRVHLFDIITHYRAAFPEDDPMLLSLKIGGGSHDDGASSNIAAIFHSWLFDKVESFLRLFEIDIVNLYRMHNVSRIESVLSQCMYFGLSLGRVGADFRGLIAPIFEKASWEFFAANVDNAQIKFGNEFLKYIDAGTDQRHVGHVSGLTSDKMTGSTAAITQPPVSLLQCPPLAVYLNGLLTLFNEIRLCLPLSLGVRVTEKLRESTETIRSSIEALKSNGNISSMVELALQLLANDLVPFLNNCLDALFPAKQLSVALGMNTAETQAFLKESKLLSISV